jgi:hypothetical protein
MKSISGGDVSMTPIKLYHIFPDLLMSSGILIAQVRANLLTSMPQRVDKF